MCCSNQVLALLAIEPQRDLIVAIAAIKPQLALGAQGSGAIEIKVGSVIAPIKADDLKAIEACGNRIAAAGGSAHAALAEDNGISSSVKGEIVCAAAT